MVLFFVSANAFPQTIKILFDATKAETAGNADWVIDADQHNLDWNPNAQTGNGDESNAQQFSTPSQSSVTLNTTGIYWNGGISSWGIDCVKQGYEVETLPYTGSITYNSTSNPQDLSNYKLFVVCEPNILFTTSEKTAILNYVQNGGRLFMISDHNQSDRNGDGYDSPAIWNDLMSANPFAIHFNLNNFSETSTSVITSLADSIENGNYGTVTQVLWSGGTDMTIDTNINATVKGVVFKNGFLNDNTKVMFAYAHYGSGRIAAMGDSSPADDGNGDTNDNLYDGYIVDANGNHQKLIMNATVWLMSDNVSLPSGINESKTAKNDFQILSNHKNLFIKNNSLEEIQIKIVDYTGKLVFENSLNKNENAKNFTLNFLATGIYFVETHNSKIVTTQKIFLTD